MRLDKDKEERSFENLYKLKEKFINKLKEYKENVKCAVHNLLGVSWKPIPVVLYPNFHPPTCFHFLFCCGCLGPAGSRSGLGDE